MATEADYISFQAYSEDSIIEEIKKKMNEGYIPVGNIQHVSVLMRGVNKTNYKQSMYKLPITTENNRVILETLNSGGGKTKSQSKSCGLMRMTAMRLYSVPSSF